MDPVYGDVQCGQEQQGQYSGRGDTTDHRVSHRPPEHLPGNRDHTQTSRSRREQDRSTPMPGRLNHRLPGRIALPFEDVDLCHQDHRVTNDDTNQRQDTQNGNKTQRRASRHQGNDHPDQPQRRNTDDQKQISQAVQLNHQEGHHEKHH